MEPFTSIAISLALGAAAVGGKTVVTEVVKEAYGKLRDLINSRYSHVSIEQLEQAPQSQKRREVVEEDLESSGARDDKELLALASRLMHVIKQEAPEAGTAIGVDLQDVEAASLILEDIAASGTAVKVHGGTFTGNIEIKKVRAGVPPASPDDKQT